MAALAAGCGASPDGGQAAAASATAFPAFPVASSWTGNDGKTYEPILGPRSGSGARRFSIGAEADLAFWFGCIGTGSARLSSPGIGLGWSIPCDAGTDPDGIMFTPTTQASPGRKVTLSISVTAPATSQWELRVDAPVAQG
ncbi:MAG: hypothetical protein ABSA02_19965 [Trebonia sp.]